MVAVRSGDLALAGSLAARALEVGTADDDPRAIGAALRLLGLVARERGDLDAARDALTRSLEIAADDPDPGAAIAARNALALVEAAAGDRDAAIRLLEEALVACRRTGELHLEAAVENNLADQLHAAGRHGGGDGPPQAGGDAVRRHRRPARRARARDLEARGLVSVSRRR